MSKYNANFLVQVQIIRKSSYFIIDEWNVNFNIQFLASNSRQENTSFDINCKPYLAPSEI